MPLIENSTRGGSKEKARAVRSPSACPICKYAITYDNGLPAFRNLPRASPNVDIRRSVLANNVGNNYVNHGTIPLGFNSYEGGGPSCVVADPRGVSPMQAAAYPGQECRRRQEQQKGWGTTNPGFCLPPDAPPDILSPASKLQLRFEGST